MPFKSKAQQGYMFAEHPEIAKEFAFLLTRGLVAKPLAREKGREAGATWQ